MMHPKNAKAGAETIRYRMQELADSISKEIDYLRKSEDRRIRPHGHLNRMECDMEELASLGVVHEHLTLLACAEETDGCDA